MDVCHQESYYVEDNVVMHDDEKCIHCRLCAAVCPHSAITTIGNELVKCDLCDGDPKCVKYCSTEALVYKEETKEQASRRRELAKRILSTS
jgi:Fe-S-cluster-containing hydrogenase component 2